MRILGISPLDKDATASAVEDGRVLFAAAEERYSRVKQHAGFPEQALAAALDAAGWKTDEVDAVAYPFLDAAREEALITEAIESAVTEADGARANLEPLLREAEARVEARDAERQRAGAAPRTVHGLVRPEQRMQKGMVKRVAYRLMGVGALAPAAARAQARRWARVAIASHRQWQGELEAELAQRGLLGKLQRSEHHLSHAANAYLASGFDRALIVTLDGYGSGLSGSVSVGEGGTIKRLAGVPFPHSLGSFYEAVTSSLGFHPDRHAGKIVGLAAYGDPEVLGEVLLATAKAEAGELRLHDNLNIYLSRHLAVRFSMVDVAAAWQHVLEVLACRYVAHWLERTGCDRLVLSGGVTANVKMNQRLHALDGVRATFVYPNMGDGGCGSGLAMLQSWPGGVGTPLPHVYLGPDWSDAELEAALREEGLACERPADLATEVARRIHAGQVVARFDGRMEYGPRALGNRSILYHAKEPGVNQWLNQRLGRTEFMPFAPVTLASAAGRCYEGLQGAQHAAEFMTMTFDCTPWMRETCPAAVHVDGTARPQLVRRETNPGYHDIVQAYERLSGIPSLINTSFNMHEEPIVCTPRDAVRAFLQGHLDSLVLGPFLAAGPGRETPDTP
ncbi:MAG: carbamoyltransferase family protein [Planctomycetota bacterium]|jgi:carbamoyltransferase